MVTKKPKGCSYCYVLLTGLQKSGTTVTGGDGRTQISRTNFDRNHVSVTDRLSVTDTNCL